MPKKPVKVGGILGQLIGSSPKVTKTVTPRKSSSPENKVMNMISGFDAGQKRAMNKSAKIASRARKRKATRYS